MGEKKTVGSFLRKTFALKKDEENPAEKKPTQTAAKPAAKKPAVKPAVKKPVAKTAASKSTASKTASPKPAAAKTTVAKSTAAGTTTSKAVPKSAPSTSSKTPARRTSAVPVSASPKTVPSKETPKGKAPVEFSKNMTKADNVRLYIYQNYFKPAKLKGQNKITLVAGDVHTDMGLKSEMPTVCSAMKTIIDRLYDAEILDVRPAEGNNSKLTVRYDLKNLYMEEESKKAEKSIPKKTAGGTGAKPVVSADSESSYLILKELEEKLRQFVSVRMETRFGKEWWKGTDMSFLADRWNERRIMNDRTNADKKRSRNELLINYASFSDYRRIINNPFAWDAFEEYFPDRGWIIQRLKELDPIRNAIMHHTPLESDDYMRLGLYSRDILKIIDSVGSKS